LALAQFQSDYPVSFIASEEVPSSRERDRLVSQTFITQGEALIMAEAMVWESIQT